VLGKFSCLFLALFLIATSYEVLNKYLMPVVCMPGTVLGAEAPVVSRIKSLLSLGFHSGAGIVAGSDN